MFKIVELLDDFQLNQKIEGKKPHHEQATATIEWE